MSVTNRLYLLAFSLLALRFLSIGHVHVVLCATLLRYTYHVQYIYHGCQFVRWCMWMRPSYTLVVWYIFDTELNEASQLILSLVGSRMLCQRVVYFHQ